MISAAVGVLAGLVLLYCLVAALQKRGHLK